MAEVLSRDGDFVDESEYDFSAVNPHCPYCNGHGYSPVRMEGLPARLVCRCTPLKSEKVLAKNDC